MVTLPLTASEDYHAISGHELTFTADNLSHNVTITIVQDGIQEELEMFILRLTNTTSPGSTHLSIPIPGVGVLIIGKLDNLLAVGA